MMKQRLEATHFIEQYNIKDEWRSYNKNIHGFTQPLPLEHLQATLACTAMGCLTIFTVALWKIKFKL